jgi:hypothetical protein
MAWEEEAHVEQEDLEEEDRFENNGEEEEGASQGVASSSRSTTVWLNFNSIYIHFCMK